MALDYAKSILLHNGSYQLLPVSKATLVELASAYMSNFNNAGNVQEALAYVAGAFAHANTVAAEAQANAYAYVGSEINNLDVAAVGSATDSGHDKFISYIYQENGYIHAFAQDMTASNIAYSGSNNRSDVSSELAYINSELDRISDDSELTLVSVSVVGNEEVEDVPASPTVSADGNKYRLKQAGKTVAEFNILQDSFVTNGDCRQANADDVAAATPAQTGEETPVAPFAVGDWIIVLTIEPKEDEEKDIYIPAESLVDAYKSGSQSGDMVFVTVDNTTNKISATITDGTVTKAKLASDVQASLDKADGAVQNVTLNGNSIVNSSYVAELSIQTGSTDGAILVNNTPVAVAGLKSIAYTGAASDVSVASYTALDTLAGLSGDNHVDDVQEALQVLATNVKHINEGLVTSVAASVDGTDGQDANNLLDITMTPSSASAGDVTVKLTHNLGGLATLDYTVVNANAEPYTF